MTAKKKTSTKGKPPARPTLRDRALSIINDVSAYDVDTRIAVNNTLTDHKASLASDAELREAIRRAESGETILDLAGVAEEYADAARATLALLNLPGVPAFVSDALSTALAEAQTRTGAGIWQEPGGAREDLGDYSPLVLARVFAHDSMLKIELEPKKDLAELLSAVLRHADTPQVISEAIKEAMAQINEDETDPRFVALILEAAARAENGGE